MMYKVTNRFTGAVQFTTFIDCAGDANTSIKRGLAVRWALENGADLSDANLRGADLSDANLRGANLNYTNLSYADLSDADLRYADLSDADLRYADLNGANLSGADLSGANLSGANLSGANLSGADLNYANLSGADLNYANLNYANLSGADLSGADPRGVHGVNDCTKCIQIDTYPITYTAEIIQIGCQRHTHQEWADFTDAQIRAMDGVKALSWWRKYKDWLFKTIEMCPAKPTKPQGT